MGVITKPNRTVDTKLLREIRKLPCAVCLSPPPNDASHIRSRGAGGGDDDFNVTPKCRSHHMEWHKWGWRKFVVQYPQFKNILSFMGWEMDGDKLWHPGMGR